VLCPPLPRGSSLEQDYWTGLQKFVCLSIMWQIIPCTHHSGLLGPTWMFPADGDVCQPTVRRFPAESTIARRPATDHVPILQCSAPLRPHSCIALQPVGHRTNSRGRTRSCEWCRFRRQKGVWARGWPWEKMPSYLSRGLRDAVSGAMIGGTTSAVSGALVGM
jgi:hypothetical protein